MNQYLVFAILGLGAGALFATLAQGIVLTYRGSGVIDLSAGAVAMYTAYTFAGLREGLLMIPPLPNPLALIEGVDGWFGGHLRLPRWPTMIHLYGGPMSTIPAVIVSAAIALLLGYIVHFLVYKRLRNAPPLGKTIASVGVLLTLQAIVILRFSTDNLAVPASLPSGTVTIGHATVPENRFILAAIAVCIAIVLTVIFRFTRMGLATRAASENEKGAILLGLSPNRLAAGNWMVSSLVSGTVGVLFASITGLNPNDYVLYVIPALGAALVAGLESFGIAAVVGILIGCAESITVLLQGNYSWFPRSGAETGIPFIIIILAMIIRGQNLPSRATLAKVRLPASPEPKRVMPVTAVLAVVAIVGLIFLPYSLRGAIDNTLIGAIVGLSYVVVVGFAGQVSLVQVGFAGLTAILMTRLAGDIGIPFPISGIIAVACAFIAGLIVGLPALRVRGVQLAVLTLGAGYVFENMALDSQSVVRPTDASNSVPVPEIFGFHFGINGSFPFGATGSPSASFGIFLLIITLLCFAAVIKLRRSDLGRAFLAVRSNERAAAALGVNVAAVKLIAFAIAAALAGVAGVLDAYQFQGVTASPYVAIASVSALAIAYLGGISTPAGAVWAGVLATGGLGFEIVQLVAHLGQYELLVSGVGLVLTAVMNPEGIAGVMRQTGEQVRRLRGRFSQGGTPAQPSPPRRATVDA